MYKKIAEYKWYLEEEINDPCIGRYGISWLRCFELWENSENNAEQAEGHASNIGNLLITVGGDAVPALVGASRWLFPTSALGAASKRKGRHRKKQTRHRKKQTRHTKILKKLTDRYKIKDKYYGIKALDKIKKLFFPNNEARADKWAKRWTSDEKKNAVYVTYFVKKRKHIYLYAKFIIGEGKRRSILGQRNINKSRKNKSRKNNAT